MKPVVVLDTNILVSAVFWSGDPYKIVQLALDEKIAVGISEELILELARILKRDFNIAKQEINDIICSIALFSTLVKSRERIEAIKDDSTDNKVLECAVSCNADYIISRDEHLLKLKNFRRIKIVKPEKFLKEIDTSLIKQFRDSLNDVKAGGVREVK